MDVFYYNPIVNVRKRYVTLGVAKRMFNLNLLVIYVFITIITLIFPTVTLPYVGGGW